LLKNARVVVAMGRIAFDGYLRLLRKQGHTIPRVEFKHGATYVLGNPSPTLICAYHPSKQNTQTGRLTSKMMDEVFRKVKKFQQ
jgi:uracil-DNA glycosylase